MPSALSKQRTSCNVYMYTNKAPESGYWGQNVLRPDDDLINSLCTLQTMNEIYSGN